MKLLVDQQLAPALASRLADLFPGSEHVSSLMLGEADDRAIWAHARDHGFTIVTKDADFSDLVALWGFPPKVVWVRLGNCTTAAIEALLRREQEAIERAMADPDVGVVSLG